MPTVCCPTLLLMRYWALRNHKDEPLLEALALCNYMGSVLMTSLPLHENSTPSSFCRIPGKAECAERVEVLENKFLGGNIL